MAKSRLHLLIGIAIIIIDFTSQALSVEATPTGIIPPSQKSVQVLPPNSFDGLCHAVINPVTGTMYVMSGDGVLHVMKEKVNSKNANISLTQLASIKLPDYACFSRPVINYMTNTIYAADPYTDTLYIMDGQSNQIVKQLSLLNESLPPPARGPSPIYLAVDSHTNAIYVSYAIRTLTVQTSANNSITAYRANFKTSVIDGNSYRILADNLTGIESGENPIAVDDISDKAYVSHYNAQTNNSTISEISANMSSNLKTAVNQVAIFTGEVQSLVFNPNTHSMYIDIFDSTSHKNAIKNLNIKTNQVSTITLSNVTEPFENYECCRVPNGGSEVSVALDARTNILYAVNMYLKKLYVIDCSSNKVVNDIRTGFDSSESSYPAEVFTSPLEVYVNPVSNTIYILHANSRALSYFAGSEIIPESGSGICLTLAALTFAVIIYSSSFRRIEKRLL